MLLLAERKPAAAARSDPGVLDAARLNTRQMLNGLLRGLGLHARDGALREGAARALRRSSRGPVKRVPFWPSSACMTAFSTRSAATSSESRRSSAQLLLFVYWRKSLGRR